VTEAPLARRVLRDPAMRLLADPSTSTAENVAVTNWIHRIEAEYREMPGLSLTRPQIQRMWGLSGDLCDVLLDSLQARQVLRLNRRGGYVAIRN
jgi:hypothetical protein